MDVTDLIILGHLAHDEVLLPDGQHRRQVGGAVLFGALAAQGSGCSCRVVTKLHPDDEALLRPLLAAGIAVDWTPSATTAGIRNIYTTADQDRRRCIPIHAGDPFTAQELPRAGAARVIHVAGLIAGQVPDDLLQPLAQQATLGLDLQGVLRVEQDGELRLRRWSQARHFLPLVTYLKADAAEAEALTGETDLDRAARALFALGPAEVVLTHASAVRVLAGGELHVAPLSPRTLAGRTGRGDSCMAAYLAARLHGREPGWAARYAAALTSIKLERDGPFSGTREQVEQRMQRA